MAARTRVALVPHPSRRANRAPGFSRVALVFALAASLAAVVSAAASAPLRAEAQSDPGQLELAVRASAPFPGELSAQIRLIPSPGQAGWTSTSRLVLGYSSAPLRNSAGIDDWLTGAGRLGGSVASVATSGAATTVSTVLPAPRSPGVWGVWVRLGLATGTVSARAVVLVGDAGVQGATHSSATALAVVALTGTPESNGLYSAEQLSSLTAPGGRLTVATDALDHVRALVGLDPRLPASIAALGPQAPPSAVAWLDHVNRLAAGQIDLFSLQFADADPNALFAVGSGLPGPHVGFSDLAESKRPQANGALAYGINWGPSAVLWPARNGLSPASLAAAVAAGVQTVVLDRAALSSSPLSAWVRLTGIASSDPPVRALVADTAISRAASQFVSAPDPTTQVAREAELGARLALADQPLVVALDREATAAPERWRSLFDTLGGTSASRLVSLTQVWASAGGQASLSTTAANPGIDRTLADRASRAAGVSADFARVTALANASRMPEIVRDPGSRAALAALDLGWGARAAGVRESLAGLANSIDRLVGSVRIVATSSMNVVASEATLPFIVVNGLDTPVRVTVAVSPSNGRLRVGNAPVIEVAAGARATVGVPVAARVGNGAVSLRVTLETPNGTALGPTIAVSANVQAEWEGAFATVTGVVLALLLVVGIYRQIRRAGRRGERSS